MQRFLNAFTYFATAVSYTSKIFMKLTPGANVMKLFTAVIYCNSKVILAFCVINVYYFSNYYGMAVNYLGILVTNVIKQNLP